MNLANQAKLNAVLDGLADVVRRSPNDDVRLTVSNCALLLEHIEDLKVSIAMQARSRWEHARSDLFAAAILQGVVAGQGGKTPTVQECADVWSCVDAMIRARGK